MTGFLLFTLYAPLASWGEIAVGETRGSWDRHLQPRADRDVSPLSNPQPAAKPVEALSGCAELEGQSTHQPVIRKKVLLVQGDKKLDLSS